MLELDLDEIYKSEKLNQELKYSSNDDKICRLCMQPMKQNNAHKQNEEFNLVPKFSETNINITEDSKSCNSCQASVGSQSILRSHLREVRKQNIDNSGHTSSKLSLKNEVFVKLEENECDENTKFIPDEQTQDELLIKSEVDVKLEKNEFEQVLVKTELIEANDSYIDVPELIEENSNLLLKDQTVKHETPESADKNKEEAEVLHTDPPDVRMYKCDKCNYTCKGRSILKKHLWRHEDVCNLQMYKCQTCEYETRLKGSLKRHQLLHKNPSELQMFACNVCEFKSKQKSSLKRHMLVHEDPAELYWHKCDKCEFKTKLKSGLKTHQLKHETPWTVRMYKCQECTFASKYSHSYKDHLLVHKDRSELRMFKCGDCEYETKYKSDLKSHALIHKNAGEVKMHQCEICEYATRHKRYLKYHRLKHDTAAAAQTDSSGGRDVKSLYGDSSVAQKAPWEGQV